MNESTNSPSHVADRRVLRTKQALHDAMLALLPEKGWDELSVQDICDRANIGRSTFYVHFQNKDELLASGLNDLREGLRLQATRRGDGSEEAFPFVRGLIEHLFEQPQVFRSIVGRRSGHVIQMRFREMILQLVAESMEKMTPPSWERDAAIHYLAGALFEMLAWSAEKSGTRTPEEIEKAFRQMSQRAISQHDLHKPEFTHKSASRPPT